MVQIKVKKDNQHNPKALALQVYIHDLCFLKLYSLDFTIYSIISNFFFTKTALRFVGRHIS